MGALKSEEVYPHCRFTIPFLVNASQFVFWDIPGLDLTRDENWFISPHQRGERVSEMFNILTQPLIRVAPYRQLTLPGVLAALARDEVDSFPALRPHQGPSWHMFLVQLGAMALRRSGKSGIPEDEESWLTALRGLTSGFVEDEPWQLVVEDWNRPAFLQSPVPDGVALGNPVFTPDGLDLLITAKNHDLKQTIAKQGQPEDWLFALVSLQTGEGYGGAGNQGIARMNGGSSSRPMLTLAPLQSSARSMAPRPGAWFQRDVAVLIETCEAELKRYDFYSEKGIGLTWLEPWPEGEQLQVKDLDIWFIEVCRRIRLTIAGEVLCGRKGTSKATRINAKHLNGALGDPFTPVHKIDNKSFTLGGRDFDHKTIVELLLSGDWDVPLLARFSSCDREGETMALVAEALARGNSKTEGFKSRILPIAGKVSRALGPRRGELHELAKEQTETAAVFDRAIGNSLALAAAQGDREKRKKDHYAFAREARSGFSRAVDSMFFEHLWDRFGAQDRGREALDTEKRRWTKALYSSAKVAFDRALPTIPCAGIFRPRAQARARAAFAGTIRYHYPELFDQTEREASDDAA